ncbi:MAG: endonuclease/exonuclease/phosphatase family protein [Bacteroidales bacterium]|nr:endonuclease/exonuclease/phosphatase family protein [Bacteroidales bacterium]
MKKTILLLACIGMLAGCAPKAPQSYYPKAKGTFRIMSYNVGAMHKYIPVLEDNVNMLAEIIKEAQPDVVGLNELDSCNQRHNVNEIELLTQAAGDWNWFYGKTLDYRGGAYGNGIITPKKTKVLSKETIQFKNDIEREDGKRFEDRGMIAVTTGKYILACSHLDHSSEEYIQSQIAEINAWVQKYKGSKIPVFFCGDMNSIPGSDAIKALEEQWEVISNQEDYTTVNSHRTIDFIFHYKDSAPVEVVGGNTLLKLYNADSEKASDHFPIFADVKF